MREYEFELRFKLPTDDTDVDDLIARLAEAGCDDALIGVGRPGRIALAFTRQSGSARHAVVSALQDVKSAAPAVELIEAGPDLVGLTDIAKTLGVSRQNVRKLVVAHSAGFPIPAHEGSATLWHLEPVLIWFRGRNYAIDQREIDVAHVTMQINLARDVERLERPVRREFRKLVA